MPHIVRKARRDPIPLEIFTQPAVDAGTNGVAMFYKNTTMMIIAGRLSCRDAGAADDGGHGFVWSLLLMVILTWDVDAVVSGDSKGIALRAGQQLPHAVQDNAQPVWSDDQRPCGLLCPVYIYILVALRHGGGSTAVTIMVRRAAIPG